MIRLQDLLLEGLEVIGPDELTPEQYDQLNQMVRYSPIRILSDRELDTVYLMDGNVAAGLWTSLRGDIFTFDVIVGRNYRKQLLGARLIKQGLDMYRQLAMDDPELKLELDVVRSRLVRPLEMMGLKVLKKVGGHTIMGYGEKQ